MSVSSQKKNVIELFLGGRQNQILCRLWGCARSSRKRGSTSKSGFRVQGTGFRVSGFRVQGFRVPGLKGFQGFGGFQVVGFGGFRVLGYGVSVLWFQGFGVQGSRFLCFRVEGVSGFRVLAPPLRKKNSTTIFWEGERGSSMSAERGRGRGSNEKEEYNGSRILHWRLHLAAYTERDR